MLVSFPLPMFLFLSTPSVRRATWRGYLTVHVQPEISIHALREEGDFEHEFLKLLRGDFYPRPP